MPSVHAIVEKGRDLEDKPVKWILVAPKTAEFAIERAICTVEQF